MPSIRLLTAALLATALSGPTLAEPQYSSQLDGLEIVALDTLPTAPPFDDEGFNCDTVRSPETPAGLAVAAQGWRVTDELALGDLTAVSFVASFEPAMRDQCYRFDGNVGFFSGDQLVALLYATESERTMIGDIQSISGGGLRVRSGDRFSVPVADLQRIGSDDIAVVPLPSEEPVCEGAASVPNIYGMPIEEAR
ncbi:MAG: hypothetical protein ACRC6I_03345, partial [Paracoccaceae bacterium]